MGMRSWKTLAILWKHAALLALHSPRTSAKLTLALSSRAANLISRSLKDLHPTRTLHNSRYKTLCSTKVCSQLLRSSTAAHARDRLSCLNCRALLLISCECSLHLAISEVWVTRQPEYTMSHRACKEHHWQKSSLLRDLAVLWKCPDSIHRCQIWNTDRAALVKLLREGSLLLLYKHRQRWWNR